MCSSRKYKVYDRIGLLIPAIAALVEATAGMILLTTPINTSFITNVIEVYTELYLH